jgi:predicted DNA-binding protein
MNCGMIPGMKVAISIPDQTFSALEKLAAERGVSRSALYNQALERMLKEIEDQALADSYNQLCQLEDTKLDPAWQAQSNRMLKKVEW